MDSFVRVEPQPLVIHDLDAPSAVLLGLCRQIITDPPSAFPHVFILHSHEPFDTPFEAVTLTARHMKLHRLVDYTSASAHAQCRSSIRSALDPSHVFVAWFWTLLGL